MTTDQSDSHHPTKVLPIRPARPFDVLPQTFGRYVLEQEIGAGGMGRVFKAVHRSLKQVVALKTIRQEKFPEGNDPAVRRFYREMESAGAVIHPNVARATDAGEEGGIHFLITEFVDGIDLQNLTRKVGPLPWGAACELLYQTCLGLNAIAEQGLVHRDIKPSNLLVTWKGQLKIVDLGLARIADVSANADSLTGSHVILGTLDFLAPEQAMSLREIDIRADLYSLGCTLVWLITGRPLFGPPRYVSPAQKIRAHCDLEPDWSALGLAGSPLLLVAKRLLAKDPKSRFQTPLEAAEALEPFCDRLGLQKLLIESASDTFLGADSRAVTETASLEDDTTRPSKPSKTWSIGKTWPAGLVAVLLMLVAGVFAIQSWKRPPSADLKSSTENEVSTPPGPRHLDGLPIRQWHDLLESPPRELYWESGNTITEWHYSPERFQVMASCGELGLLELGTTDASDYTFQLGLKQQDLSGGLGLFLGAHPETENGQEVLRYQFFEIKAGRIGSKKTYSVTRNWGTIPRLKDSRRHLTGSTASVIGQAFKPAPSDQCLEVKIAQGRLQHVKINGVLLPELAGPLVNDKFSPADTRGGLGIWMKMSDGTIRNAKFSLDQ